MADAGGERGDGAWATARGYGGVPSRRPVAGCVCVLPIVCPPRVSARRCFWFRVYCRLGVGHTLNRRPRCRRRGAQTPHCGFRPAPRHARKWQQIWTHFLRLQRPISKPGRLSCHSGGGGGGGGHQMTAPAAVTTSHSGVQSPRKQTYKHPGGATCWRTLAVYLLHLHS